MMVDESGWSLVNTNEVKSKVLILSAIPFPIVKPSVGRSGKKRRFREERGE